MKEVPCVRIILVGIKNNHPKLIIDGESSQYLELNQHNYYSFCNLLGGKVTMKNMIDQVRRFPSDSCTLTSTT